MCDTISTHRACSACEARTATTAAILGELNDVYFRRIDPVFILVVAVEEGLDDVVVS